MFLNPLGTGSPKAMMMLAASRPKPYQCFQSRDPISEPPVRAERAASGPKMVPWTRQLPTCLDIKVASTTTVHTHEP